jgi:hypothetical protein
MKELKRAGYGTLENRMTGFWPGDTVVFSEQPTKKENI